MHLPSAGEFCHSMSARLSLSSRLGWTFLSFFLSKIETIVCGGSNEIIVHFPGLITLLSFTSIKVLLKKIVCNKRNLLATT